MTPAGKRFDEDKDAACSLAGIVTVLLFWLSRLHQILRSAGVECSSRQAFSAYSFRIDII
jgi:hypothetical protein